MAKLNAETAALAASKAEEDGSFPILEPGPYHVQLVGVDPDREGPRGPYWSWEFKIVEPGSSGRLWENTSLSEAGIFRLNQAFAAFGETAEADTDDLIGQCAKALVGVRTMEGGDRAGDKANTINKLVKVDAGFEPPEPESSGANAEDIFA